ncbi:MAG: DNA-directed RNA polymerase subunit P [Candidatus Aenigmarchaeota archaeon]|nr:DNA-directed RNA polymerase subunit P [Candidatus Aenigmarchaeota archaeon]
MYKCVSCMKSIEFDNLKEKIRCPYCGYRIIVKERPKTVRKVLAR